MTITTTLPLPTCLHQSEAGEGAATEAATHTPQTSMVMRTTMITMAMTTTTTAGVTRTRTTGTTTSKPLAGGGVAVATGVLGEEPHQPEDVAVPVPVGDPEAGPTSPSVAVVPDQAVEDGVQEEEVCSQEGEEGYVVRGVAAVEM